MTLEEVQKDVESQVQHVQLVSYEVERLKQQLASEKKHVTETSMELQALRRELEKSKTEAEQLKSLEDRKQARSKSRLELEDAKNAINELKEELAYKSNVNRSLGLQLEKTIESNSELLLEIQDLDEQLLAREAEIKVLTAGSGERQGNEELEINEQKATLMQKLEENEQEREELKRIILTLEGSRANQVSEADTQELRADIEVLRRELEKTETEAAEASKENMNLLSQLMDLRHQTDEKEVFVQQLMLQLTELQEKLHLSEELFQSQLDSNKGFLEDLNSTVEGLRAHNDQLKHSLTASEDRNSSLIEEVEMQQKEILAHQKEKSLLGSQKGQLKILREKIAAITENYEDAVKRGEELDLVNMGLKEENRIALGQLKSSQDELHESSADCIALREKIEVAETQARDADERAHLLLGAKEAIEASEATISSSRAEHAQLQEKMALLVEDKERGDASLSSLQEAHTGLQDQLRKAEFINSEALHQLQERMQEERASQYSCIQDLEFEIKHTKEELGASREALFVSEDKIQKLQLQNEDLAELLQSAVSFKEEVVSRLEAAIEKEAELYQKLQEAQQALHCAENYKASSDQALQELQDRVRLLEDERNASVKGKKSQEDRRGQPKGLQAQSDALKAEKAKTRKDKTKTNNDTTINIKRGNTSLDDRDFRFLQDSSPKAGKKGTDIDQKSDVMKLRKNAADLRRKLLEQEEEKDEMRKKLASIQKEAQRKSDLLISTERRLKEKEKDQQIGQRPITRRHSSIGSYRVGMMDNNAPNGPKATVDLLEKVKLLEGELSIKTVELEATKFVLKQREAGPCSNSNMEKENCVNDQADTDSQEFPAKENQQLKNSLLTHNEESNSLEMESEDNSVNNHPLPRKSEEKEARKEEEETDLQEELREMKERYSQMSLEFAELQVANDELLVTIRNQARDNHK